MFKWITWCSIKAGNDGRRPSGVVWQRTTVRHAVADDGVHTLCKLEVGNLVSVDDADVPKCKSCMKKANAEIKIFVANQKE